MPGIQPKIYFHYLCPISFSKRSQIKELILSLLKKEGRAVETINYIFCSDEYLLAINQKYLKHNTYTDIVTFELSAAPQPILADIYISIERVRENAKDLELPFRLELLRVILHGALHLCGLKDKTKEQKQLMRAKEEFYLNKFLRFT